MFLQLIVFCLLAFPLCSAQCILVLNVFSLLNMSFSPISDIFWICFRDDFYCLSGCVCFIYYSAFDEIYPSTGPAPTLLCVCSCFQWYILPRHHCHVNKLYPLKCIICIYFSLWSLTTEGKFTGRGRVEELGALNRRQIKCIRTGNATVIILSCFKSSVPHGQHQLTSKTWFCSPLLHPADS